MTTAGEHPLPPTSAIELPTASPDRCSRCIVRRDAGIVMRDGVRLSANVFLPEATRRAPAVLIRQPYGKDDHTTMWARGKYWARKGYACVIQDVRGRFGSEGEWRPFVHEAADGWDTLDWLAAQPWCDGRVGMSGESYYGYTQWAVAASGHPNLRCIAPGDSSPDPYLFTYRAGALALGIAKWACTMTGRTYADTARWDPWRLPLTELDEAMGLRSPMLQAILQHPSRDEFWDQVDVTPRLADIRIPVLHYGGWYDLILPGTLAGWDATAAARARGGEGADQRLIIGPTDHSLTPVAYGGAPDDSPGAWTFDHVQRFFDRHLRGEEDALDGVPPVRVFVTGAERWREAAAWPLPGTRLEKYYLRSSGGARTAAGDGRLDPARPGDEQPDVFIYDPEHPVDVWLRESAWDLTWTIRDRANVEARDDVLVYTAPPLEEDVEIAGPVTVTLYAASSAPDTDFTAAVLDVAEDGSTSVLQEGIVRARYRSSDRQPELIEPGAVVEYAIDLLATAHLFAAGHRVRVEVSSSNFGRFDRNPNTGGTFAVDTMCRTARQVVHHSRAYPSHITLPVIPPDGARARASGSRPAN